MPKPLTITDELTAKLCASLRQGKPKFAAAAEHGVARTTLKDWLRKGEDAAAKHAEGHPLTANDEAYLTFAADFELAQDAGEAWLVDQILESAGGSKSHLKKWQAYMTLLERTRPDQWRRRAAAEYIDRDRKPAARIDVSLLDKTERAQLRQLLTKAAPDGD